ncbi:MAG: Holliday junction resolvase RuvX [Chloroflexi bacterium]|nr:Holliday junction resolvase RuvX [Chloroflexota bacterium]
MEGRVLGLDVGEKWIGVALSDPCGILASPLTRIPMKGPEPPEAAIGRLVSQHQVKGVVGGLPYSMDGTLGQQGERVRAFLQKLSDSLGIPVETWDERLSTVAASRRMIEGGAGRGARREGIDAAAAAYILQGYLDRRRFEEA